MSRISEMLDELSEDFIKAAAEGGITVNAAEEGMPSQVRMTHDQFGEFSLSSILALRRGLETLARIVDDELGNSNKP